MAEGKTKAEQYYEAVEALKGSGMSNAGAIRQVAEELSVSANAVRGSLYQYKTKLNGGTPPTTRRSRRSVNTVEDHLAAARQAVEDALALIDREVDDAQAALEAAQAHYDQVSGAVKDRKADLEQKLASLS